MAASAPSRNPLLSREIAALVLFISLHFALIAAQLPYEDCPATVQNYTANSSFQSNLDALLKSLVSNASVRDGFYNVSVGKNQGDTVYGLALCRGDVARESTCRTSLDAAAKGITQACPFKKSASIWYEYCLLRYSDSNFFSLMEDAGKITLVNSANVSDPDGFRPVVSNLLGNLTNRTVSDSSLKMYAAGKMPYSGGDVYGMVQCTRDLTLDDCNRCLQGAIGDVIGCCYYRRGSRLLSTSCTLRFELYSFFSGNSTAFPTPPASGLSPPPKSSGKGGKIIIAIVVPAVVIILVLILIYACFIRKKSPTKNEIDDDISSVESLLYELESIKAATNNFADENKLGEGGFGAVYKGMLQDGQEIAVKRLSKDSSQGTIEFKNEVQLVARLQHKNLVRLLGYCAEGGEKILIYEYVPNASLNQFLFEPSKKKYLNWEIRYKIISGIARGLLYLHEDSRLKIVHRDLKASNILLDSDMNPKVADFGMARLFGADQTQVSTRIVAGTFGYIAPEYAMRGHFSVKSDVFSYGVLLLEIVSGQKNNEFKQEDETDLLSYAWRVWNEGKPLELMDPEIGESFNRSEVLRCINIGLLCVQEDDTKRPSMNSVVLMLSSFTMSLPTSEPPPFVRRGGKTEFSKNVLQSDSTTTEEDKSTSVSMPISNNDVSISEIMPR